MAAAGIVTNLLSRLALLPAIAVGIRDFLALRKGRSRTFGSCLWRLWTMWLFWTVLISGNLGRDSHLSFRGKVWPPLVSPHEFAHDWARLAEKH